LPSRPAELSRLLGGVLRVVHCNVPPWTARPPGRPVMAYVYNLCATAPMDLRRPRGHEPRGSATPHGSATSAWPRHRAAPNRSQHRATAPPTPNDGNGSTSSRRLGASSTRSWPSYTKS
jgi:hypothetical protein